MESPITNLQNVLNDLKYIKEDKKERRIFIELIFSSIKKLSEYNSNIEEEKEEKSGLLFNAYLQLSILHEGINEYNSAINDLNNALEISENKSLKERKAFLLGIIGDLNFKYEFDSLITNNEVSVDYYCRYIYLLELHNFHDEAKEKLNALLENDLSNDDINELITLFSNLVERYEKIETHQVDELKEIIESKKEKYGDAIVISTPTDISVSEEIAPEVGLSTIAKIAGNYAIDSAKKFPFRVTMIIAALVMVIYPFFVATVGDTYLSVINYFYGIAGGTLIIAYFLASDGLKHRLTSIFWVLVLGHFITYVILVIAAKLPFNRVIWWWVLTIYLLGGPILNWHSIKRGVNNIKDITNKSIEERKRFYFFFLKWANNIIVTLAYLTFLRFFSIYFKVEMLYRLGLTFQMLFLLFAWLYTGFARNFKFKKLRDELMIICILFYILMYVVYINVGELDFGKILNHTILETMVLVLLIYTKKFILEKDGTPPFAGILALSVGGLNLITLMTLYPEIMNSIGNIIKIWNPTIAIINLIVALISMFVGIMAYRKTRATIKNRA